MTVRTCDEVAIDQLVFPEGLRWHADHLWFCDVESHDVLTADSDGQITERRAFPGEHPIGLAWKPDGTLVVGGRFERLFTYTDGRATMLHDLRRDGPESWSNDAITDTAGRIYVSSFGMAYDLEDHASNEHRLKGAGRILLVDVDGTIREVATGLSMPNTMQLTPDGATLICSDSMAHRVVAYDVLDDGLLGPERVVATFECMPDGSTLDAEGALWVALPPAHEARRLLDGTVTDVVTFDDEVFDLALGGPDGHTLYAAVSNLTATTPPPAGAGQRNRPGRICRIRTDVPKAS